MQLAAIIVPIVCTIVFGLLAFALTQTLGRLNDRISVVNVKLSEHVEDCELIDKRVLSSGLTTMRSEVTRTRDIVHWLGNCVMLIAGKLGVKLPERPRLPEDHRLAANNEDNT